MDNVVSVWRVVCVYFTSICMLGGGMHWAFFFTLTAQMASFDVYAVDDLKKELNAKYQLDTPKNVDGTEVFNKIMSNKDKSSGYLRDIEYDVLSRPASSGNDVDLSAFDDVDFDQEYTKYMGEGIKQGRPQAPSMTDGNIDANYYEKAGTSFSRDKNGELVVTQIQDSERGAKTTSIQSSEVFTNQQNRPDEEFNAPGNYGDESAYIDDLKVQYDKTSDGKTMNSEAYRAIMNGAAENPAPKISSDSYIFEKTNTAISDAQNGEGIWSQSCVDETTTETEIKHIPIWENRLCQKPSDSNENFCEISRVLEPNPAYIENQTPQYIEKYIQYPEGCADKAGWKPICPDNSECSSSGGETGGSGSIPTVPGLPPGKDELRVMSSNLESNASTLLASRATVKKLSPVYPIIGYDENMEPRWETIVGECKWVGAAGGRCYPINNGDVKEIDGQLYKASQCDVKQISHIEIHSTCLFSPLQCASTEMPGFQSVIGYNSSGVVAEFGWIINKDGADFVPTNCRGATPHAPGLLVCDFKLACVNSPRVCDIAHNCENYTPQYPVNDFCTFDEWEVIEQGTNNYPQKLIQQMARMFDGDPNPEALYGGDANAEGQYHVATWKINAKGYSCDPLKGNDYCISLLNDETQEFEEKCFNYQDIQEFGGTCEKYETDSRCEKTSDSCAEGWYDASTSICYMSTDDYRCDVSSPIEVTQTKTTNVCAGMLPCMGNDCAYGEEEKSNDFEKAVLMGSIAQTVDDDSNCVSEDPNTCEIFPGEAEYCSWEVSGMGNNCCDAPSGINYLEMVAMGYKMMQTETFKSVSSTLSGGVTDQVGGLYSDFTTMLVDGWNTGATAVVDFASSIMGDPEFMQGVADSVSMGSTSASAAIGNLLYTMKEQVYSTINSMLPKELGKMLFKEATASEVSKGTAQEIGDTMLSDMMSQAASIVSIIGWIYTIYNVIKILANLLTQCDENEQDMGVKLAQKQCFAVGGRYCHKKVLGVCMIRRQNYCCFSSMLSRIIADQGSKQIGKDMATCPGFTVEEFGRIDFDKLDLSEWLSTMYESDILSSSGYDIDRLTGDGRMFGNTSCEGSDDPNCVEMERKNAEERAVEQFNGDASGPANELKDNFNPDDIDCSVYPRPMICDLNN